MTGTVEDLLGRLERRMGDVEELEAPAREAVYEFLDGIDALHRRALTSLVELDTPRISGERAGADR